MVKLIGFDSCQLGFKFIENESISLRTIFVAEDEGMAKMNGIGSEIRHRENRFDSLLSLMINMIAEKDCRFTEIGSLSRDSTEMLESVIDVDSLRSRCLTADY